MKKMLNLGCGSTYDKRWINIDLYKTGSDVIQADLTKGLPFKNNSFDAVYCSHLLEHFNFEDGQNLLREIYRVLKKRGIIRIVVPDLESIARVYLQKLNESLAKKRGAEDDYDWMFLELYDQVGRNKSGGDMLSYITDPNLPNKEFVLSRVGKEAENILQKCNVDSVSRIKQVVKIFKNRGVKWSITFLHELCVGQL